MESTSSKRALGNLSDLSNYGHSYAFIPQLIALCILYGVSASKYDLTTPSEGDARTVAGDRYVTAVLIVLHSKRNLARYLDHAFNPLVLDLYL